jgi:hypothetical protein
MGKIHLFYIDSDEQLAGQTLSSNESMRAHTFPSLPEKHADSQLAAAYDPDTGDVHLWYQESNAGIQHCSAPRLEAGLSVAER